MNNVFRLAVFILFNLIYCNIPSQILLNENIEFFNNSHNVENGLADNTIFDIRYGDNNILFLGTGEGLSYIDLSSFNNQELGQLEYFHFSLDENLPDGGNSRSNQVLPQHNVEMI